MRFFLKTLFVLAFFPLSMHAGSVTIKKEVVKDVVFPAGASVVVVSQYSIPLEQYGSFDTLFKVEDDTLGCFLAASVSKQKHLISISPKNIFCEKNGTGYRFSRVDGYFVSVDGFSEIDMTMVNQNSSNQVTRTGSILLTFWSIVQSKKHHRSNIISQGDRFLLKLRSPLEVEKSVYTAKNFKREMQSSGDVLKFNKREASDNNSYEIYPGIAYLAKPTSSVRYWDGPGFKNVTLSVAQKGTNQKTDIQCLADAYLKRGQRNGYYGTVRSVKCSNGSKNFIFYVHGNLVADGTLLIPMEDNKNDIALSEQTEIEIYFNDYRAGI